MSEFLEAARLDARYAWRSLRRSPASTLVAVSTLALGIGANTAIFSVVHATLIEPLPFPRSDRLAFVWTDRSEAGDSRMPLSGPELLDLRERNTLFEGFAAIWSNTAALTGEPEPEQIRVGLVSGDFFQLLGARPAVGRGFEPADEGDAQPRVILLSFELWQRRYGGDSALVGRSIRVNGQPATVVGVMPRDFRLLMPPDAAVPDDLQAWLPFNRNFVRGPRGQQFLRVVGRLRDGVLLEQARQEISRIAAAISKEFPDYGSAGRRFTLVALHADGVREMRPVLLALFGGVAILLLIACVNVAGLLIARAAARASETAVRLALGAGRAEIVRRCLAEGLLLAGLGVVAGLATAKGVLSLLVALRPEGLARIESARIDLSVLAFTAATALLWGLLLSLAPLAELFRTDLKTALQRDGRAASGSVRHRTRAGLVVAQLALGCVLLVAAGLMVRSVARLRDVDPGFRYEGILTFRLTLPGARYATPEAANEFSRRLQAELLRLPGVARVGAISHLPYDTLPNWSTGYLSDAGQDASLARRADARALTPGFLAAASARLLEGRDFEEADDRRGTSVVIVDETLARRAWPGASAVGKRMLVDPRVTGRPAVEADVVGVIAHLRHRTLVADVREQVYFPVRQIPRNPMAYLLKTEADPAGLAAPIRGLLARLDPELPIFDVRPLSDYVETARATQRFTMLLALVFAGAALLLASVGVYGVLAYSVTRRRHEFGVRLALGAHPSDVVKLVLREGALLAAIGSALGLLTALPAARLLQAQLYGVSARDPISYLFALPVLGLVASLAGWLPARRATRASPLDALRAE